MRCESKKAVFLNGLGTLVIVMAMCFFSGCGFFEPKEPEVTQALSLEKLPVKKYPQFSDTRNFSGLEQALTQSMVYFNKLPGSRQFAFGPDVYTAAHMIRTIATLQAFVSGNPSEVDLNRFIRDCFHVYGSTANDKNQVLFTGYFEPTFNGSLYPDDRFLYPLYSLPEDLVEIDLAMFSDKYKGHDRLKGRVAENRVVPYFSRQDINGMTDFHQRAVPVAWLESRVDRFFLEIQGSGRLQTPDKEIIRVHYAGSNGNQYRSIGRYLIEKQEIAKENMSMQAIRQWLEDHPERMDEVLHHNESFVFFRTETGGPFGSIGVQLTPLRSMATDYRLFPRGAPCFVNTALPDPDNPNSIEMSTDLDQWDRVSLFVMNQDTGGAIRGPGRADLFCGSDGYARFAAGHMNIRGQLYFLVLKP
ncbi:MAG: MltA domain-containing protein [Desulfotignum sp.]|jgi:membrane-bound lytic murein transglycosylase A|nr:MltA domain-containing protein [Desulfotignum sp.]